MLKEPVKRALAAMGRTSPGRHVLHAATATDRGSGLFRDARWPATAANFEDLAFLFTSSQLNHGIASLRFDEAALLFTTARSLGPATIVELGRFKGGGTFLLAVAMHPESELWSYDLHLEVPVGTTGEQLDSELHEALSRYGLRNVHVLVADTSTAAPPPGELGLLFVDADHSYAGARRDFDRWSPLVRVGGHVLLHDGVDVGGYGRTYAGVQQLVAEIESLGGEFRRAQGAGSIAHFIRQAAAAS